MGKLKPSTMMQFDAQHKYATVVVLLARRKTIAKNTLDAQCPHFQQETIATTIHNGRA
jgi:hypothetical protein